jgi:hypothetical protein
MSAAEYWDALERLLAAEWAKDVPDKLIEKGWAPEANLTALAELVADHDGQYSEDDNEWDSYCICGKWLERDCYEWPDHFSSVLEDSGLLSPGEPWLEDQENP